MPSYGRRLDGCCCVLSVLSDHHICGRGHHPPHAHLPAQQDLDRHRSHPGVQQVSGAAAQ